MSAFLCPPEHIGALAQFAHQHNLAAYRHDSSGEVQRAETQEQTEELAELLARENLASLAVRYPDSGHAADWINFVTDDADFFHQCKQESRRTLRTRQPLYTFEGPQGACNVYGMASCYSYQSCEHPGWHTSAAHDLMARIKDKCVRMALPREMELALWTYYEPVTEEAANV